MASVAKQVGAAMFGVGAGLAAVTAFYSVAIERKDYRIRFEDVPILPKGSRPIAILHLADIHLAPWHGKTVSWLQGLRDLEPDFIVNTGRSEEHTSELQSH